MGAGAADFPLADPLSSAVLPSSLRGRLTVTRRRLPRHFGSFALARPAHRQSRPGGHGGTTVVNPSQGKRVDSSTVEQRPFKSLVLGSNPSRPTMLVPTRSVASPRWGLSPDPAAVKRLPSGSLTDLLLKWFRKRTVQQTIWANWDRQCKIPLNRLLERSVRMASGAGFPIFLPSDRSPTL